MLQGIGFAPIRRRLLKPEACHSDPQSADALMVGHLGLWFWAGNSALFGGEISYSSGNVMLRVGGFYAHTAEASVASFVQG